MYAIYGGRVRWKKTLGIIAKNFKIKKKKLIFINQPLFGLSTFNRTQRDVPTYYVFTNILYNITSVEFPRRGDPQLFCNVFREIIINYITRGCSNIEFKLKHSLGFSSPKHASKIYKYRYIIITVYVQYNTSIFKLTYFNFYMNVNN